ncbi:hypothetical protein TL16_g05466, partial [Triparma laevis f. inornata]|uniref:Eukaryotic translation initiation factor 3 subunit 7 n=2 Tax=Triparma laevis TaxID=1534972 RepID=A0A9W7DS09_9STRA
MDFPPPNCENNADSWGPLETNLPAQYLALPYAPFSPSDRLGKSADFTQSASWQQKKGHKSQGMNEDFMYKVEESADFKLVDTKKEGGNGQKWKRKTFQPRRNNQHQRSRFGGNKVDPNAEPAKKEYRNQPQRNKWAKAREKGWQKGRNNRWNNRVDRQASVRVEQDWEMKEEFDLAQLIKLKANIPTVTDLTWAGHSDPYNENYDKLSTKTARPLRRMEDRGFYTVTTMEDPIIENYAVNKAGNVFATDGIISHLMACTRSVYPWDVIVQKLPDGTLFFDKRDSSQFDMLTVSETSNDPPKVDEDDPDSINTPDKLSLEATMINQNFSQQCLQPKGRVEMEHPNPFFDEEEEEGMKPASVAYRYRKFSMGPDTDLVVRCELHGHVMKKGERQNLTCFALNEWDGKEAGGIEWRSKIDTQKGAVLATELKNNSAKLARWSAQSILADADIMKIGFVSRTDKKSPNTHEVLGTSQFKPNDFAVQINMNVQNMWGIIKMLVELMRKQDDGKYVILRDPNKPLVRIYKVPMSFNEDSDSDESEEDSSEEEDDEE